MNAELLAQIIAGEGGCDAMFMDAVAGVIATQISHNYAEARISRVWLARKEPTGRAIVLARRLDAGTVLASGYLFCLSAQDVAKMGCRAGDVVLTLRGTELELHLYQEWPA